MSAPDFPAVSDLTQLQIDTVELWHREPIANTFDGIRALVCTQHEYNYRLWHEEDTARSPSAADEEVANVKRAIDKLNQARNDMIEKVDDALTEILSNRGIDASGAPINTETVGSAIDRLSIMALRLYHYQEQHDREDANDERNLDADESADQDHRAARDRQESLGVREGGEADE